MLGSFSNIRCFKVSMPIGKKSTKITPLKDNLNLAISLVTDERFKVDM